MTGNDTTATSDLPSDPTPVRTLQVAMMADLTAAFEAASTAWSDGDEEDRTCVIADQVTCVVRKAPDLTDAEVESLDDDFLPTTMRAGVSLGGFNTVAFIGTARLREIYSESIVDQWLRLEIEECFGGFMAHRAAWAEWCDENPAYPAPDPVDLSGELQPGEPEALLCLASGLSWDELDAVGGVNGVTARTAVALSGYDGKRLWSLLGLSR